MFAPSLLVVSCITNTKIDKLSKKEFKKNVKAKKILLHAKYEGVANIKHQFTLRENHKFAYTSFAFGSETYYIGDWSKSKKSDTIHLKYHLNHGFQKHLSFLVLKKSLNAENYIELSPIDSSAQPWQFKITYLTEQFVE